MFEILRSGGGGSLQEPVSVFFCGYREFTGKVQRPEPPKSGPFGNSQQESATSRQLV